MNARQNLLIQTDAAAVLRAVAILDGYGVRVLAAGIAPGATTLEVADGPALRRLPAHVLGRPSVVAHGRGPRGAWQRAAGELHGIRIEWEVRHG